MSVLHLKMELHSHTDFDPCDSIRHSATQLIDAAAEQGYGVLAITCHKAFQWEGALAEYASARGILLIPGVEASIEGKDVLIYGLKRYRHPMSFAQLRELRRVHPEVVAVAPHPFFPGSSCLGPKLTEYRDCFDAIEYSHFYTRQVNFNHKALAVARQLDLPVIGTSDVHFLNQLGRTYSRITLREKSYDAFVEAIRGGQVELITQSLTWFELGQVLLQLKAMDLRSALTRYGVIARRSAQHLLPAEEDQ